MIFAVAVVACNLLLLTASVKVLGSNLCHIALYLISFIFSIRFLCGPIKENDWLNKKLIRIWRMTISPFTWDMSALIFSNTSFLILLICRYLYKMMWKESDSSLLAQHLYCSDAHKFICFIWFTIAQKFAKLLLLYLWIYLEIN
jgi:hypothetical protein